MNPKHADELGWWIRETAEVILPWYLGERMGVWGHKLPKKKVESYPTNWENALATLARLQRHYYSSHLHMRPDTNRGRMLDVGCGPMLPARHLACRELWCLDPLLEAYLTAGFPVRDANAVLLPIGIENLWTVPSGTFDTTISVNALDHVDNFAEAVAEIERVTKSEGLIRFEVTYHAPTPTEPLALNDTLVRSAFTRPIYKVGGTETIDKNGLIYAVWSTVNAYGC